MKHDQCSHERTPAGRAACRKGLQSPVGASTPATPKATKADAARRSRRTLKAPGQFIRLSTDADVPDPLRPYIKRALDLGYAVSAGSPYTEAERVVRVVSDAGTMQLVWDVTLPFGVHDVQFRPHNSSVSRRLPSVNEGMRQLQPPTT